MAFISNGKIYIIADDIEVHDESIFGSVSIGRPNIIVRVGVDLTNFLYMYNPWL